MRRLSTYWQISILFFILLALTVTTSMIAVDITWVSVPRLVSIVSGLILAGVISFFGAWVVANKLIKRPIQNLSESVRRLCGNESGYMLEERENDEFRELVSAINDMASMLASSQTELRKNKDYLEGILESTPDIIISVNSKGTILTINSGAETALGYSRSEVLGKPIDLFFADTADKDSAVERLKHSDNITNFETRFITQNGKERDILLALSNLRNHKNEIISTIGIGKDITDVKLLQDQLIQSQRYAAIGQVFTGIQHSMKNMLNACKGGSYMVKVGLKKDDRGMFEEGWEIVQGGINNLTDMSLDMLKYVREWKPKLERVDLSPMLSEIDRIIKKTAKDKGVDFTLDIPDGLPAIVCDVRMIHSSVMDIVSNALDACFWKEYKKSETPEVVLSAYPNDDSGRLVVEIRDNGIGMTEEVRANIFTPFFSTKSKSGTGLGLAITSRMIEVHGGEFDVESEPNRGTVFRIILPIEGINLNKEKANG